jgi:hypothetical protein
MTACPWNSITRSPSSRRRVVERWDRRVCYVASHLLGVAAQATRTLGGAIGPKDRAAGAISPLRVVLPGLGGYSVEPTRTPRAPADPGHAAQRASASTLASPSTSATLAARGNATATRTPTVCCASTSPSAATSELRAKRPRRRRRRTQQPSSTDPLWLSPSEALDEARDDHLRPHPFWCGRTSAPRDLEMFLERRADQPWGPADGIGASPR